VILGRRWIALLLFAVLLFAAIGDPSHSMLWAAILEPILFVLGLILLSEELLESSLAVSAPRYKLVFSTRAPPLS
jgi:hypothetical protein